MRRSRCRRRRGRRPTAARASRSAIMSFSPSERRLGRASDPFFLPAVLWPICGLPTPSLPHADDPQVYIPSKPALLYCPSSLRVDPFLLPSAVPKLPILLLLLEVKLVHIVDSKRWFKQGRKWESCSTNLGLGSKRKRGKVVIFVTVSITVFRICANRDVCLHLILGCLSPYRFYPRNQKHTPQF